MNLSIIVPAYNEEKRITKTLESLAQYLAKQDFESEVIVVSDGSTDRTSEKVKDFEGRIKNLKLIDNKENQGKGAVVRQGMLEAQGKYRLFMDADNSTTIDHIEKAWPLFAQGYQVVIGTRDSRDIKEAKQLIAQPLLRRFLGNVGNLIIQVVAVPGIWDTQCGFKVFTNDIVNQVFPKTRIQRWGFDIEILFIIQSLGYKKKIAMIHVDWKNDIESKVGLKGYFQVLRELFQIRINSFKGYYNEK
jgi:dolichyl-phosphate beta-glucosyltransferase